jgi:hypothetical protein
MDDFVDTPGRDFYRTCQAILADLLWFHVLLQQYFSGVLA